MRFRSLSAGAVLVALLAAGCGRENPELIPRQDADELIALVQEAGQAIADGDCDAAHEAVAEAERRVAELPRRVNRDLEDNLNAWLRHLDGRIETECDATPEETATPTPTATETPTATPTPTPTTPPRRRRPPPTRPPTPDPRRRRRADARTRAAQERAEEPDGGVRCSWRTTDDRRRPSSPAATASSAASAWAAWRPCSSRFDTRLERHVAVKLLAEHLAEDRNFVSRFRREALGRRAPRAPQHRPGLRLRHATSAPAASTSSWSTSTARAARSSCASRAAWRPTRRSTSSPRPAAGSTTRTATASSTATSSRATCCAAATAGRSSSPTSGSPRRPSSPTSRRSARCSAPRPTSRPSRRAASRRARRPTSTRSASSPTSCSSGRLPYEAASLTDLARQQEAGRPPALHELDPDIPRGAVAGGRARAGARPGGPLRRRAARWSRRWRDGLRGVPPPAPTAPRAPLDATDATRPLERTEATRPLTRTAPAESRRRRLEPIQERRRRRAPGRARRARPRRPAAGAPAAPARRAAAPARAAARARRRRRGGRGLPVVDRRVRARRPAQGAGAGRRRAGASHELQRPDRGQHPLAAGAPPRARRRRGAPPRSRSASRPASIAARRAAISCAGRRGCAA